MSETCDVSVEIVRTWPPIIPASKADLALGTSYKTGLALRRAGDYPIRWLAIGRSHKVRTVDLLAFLTGDLALPDPGAPSGPTGIAGRRAG